MSIHLSISARNVRFFFAVKTNTYRRKLKDVILGEAAINYEEGKWEKKEGDTAAIFKPDYDIIRTPAGDLQAFAESKERPNYHYGEYISGSAVRHDSSTIFDKIRTTVSRLFFVVSIWILLIHW